VSFVANCINRLHFHSAGEEVQRMIKQSARRIFGTVVVFLWVVVVSATFGIFLASAVNAITW
jgi:hypothetical protein